MRFFKQKIMFLCEIYDPFAFRLVPNSRSVFFLFLYFISLELKKSKEITSKVLI